MDITITTIISSIISAALGLVLGRFWTNLDKKSERNQETLDRINKLLPYDVFIEISERDFAGPFPTSYGSMFDKFSYESSDPAFKFIDAVLEKKRLLLLHKIQEFSSELAIKTFPIGNPNIHFNKLPQAHEMKNPDDWITIRTKLNSLADEVFEIYSDLQRASRNK